MNNQVHPALKVICGVCGAHPGDPCVTPSGRLRKAPHQVRTGAAKRAKRGEGPPHSRQP